MDKLKLTAEQAQAVKAEAHQALRTGKLIKDGQRKQYNIYYIDRGGVMQFLFTCILLSLGDRWWRVGLFIPEMPDFWRRYNWSSRGEPFWWNKEYDLTRAGARELLKAKKDALRRFLADFDNVVEIVP